MNPYNKVAFHTLGCKLNFSETSTIARSFMDAGYSRVDYSEFADVYVINTCSVTDHADKKTRNFINRAKRTNPESKVVIIGCYAQLKPEEIVTIPGVDLVLGANDKFNVLEQLENHKSNEAKLVNTRIGQVREFIPSYSVGDRTRSFLKVQDGCDYFCSFCTIPLARGKSRNGDIETIVEKAKEIASQGVKEIVLTGVNIGDFGQGKSTNPTFFDLIQTLDEMNGIERFRISSIEPNLLSDDIIEFVAQSNRFMPHFHIPLQSGHDELLKSMKRKYDSKLYTQRIEKIKALIPNACIGVDVIVGYPGESDAHFEHTYNYLKDLEVSYLHVFTYSERANTVADKLERVVPKAIRSERSKRLRILSSKLKRNFYQNQLGTTSTVLFESDNVEGKIQGFTENYLRVEAPFDEALVNSLQQCEMKEINGDGLFTFKPLSVYA